MYLYYHFLPPPFPPPVLCTHPSLLLARLNSQSIVCILRVLYFEMNSIHMGNMQNATFIWPTTLRYITQVNIPRWLEKKTEEATTNK